ncbi:hypothetical protein BH11BAC4_BH11BAC4_04010 [soil metagenome]
MKFIKGFVFAIAGLFVVVTLFSLLMPSKVMTVRSVVIHGTTEQVFAEIGDLNKWKRWHPVFMHDSNSIRISSHSFGVNAIAEWETKGKTNRLLITQVASTQLTAELSRTGENTLPNIIAVTALKDSNNIQVEWRVLTRLKWYPWEKFSGIFVDKMTGPGYEAALNNLKILIEGKR